MSRLGVAVIGRNEGERLKICLRSLAEARVVYVDSGSTDGSVETVRGLGAEVVELDLGRPFTAARARNAGLERLLQIAPETLFVQFVDGDCEIAPGWLVAAEAALEANPRRAMVAGRLRERYPEKSIYNQLCDMEWAGPVGVVRHCGGVMMARVEALRQVGGFDPAVIAGEEPELCLRLLRHGWIIERLANDMGWHDAAMMRFGQWWRRATRSGYAYALGRSMHGHEPERFNVAAVRNIVMWAGVLPVAALALLLFTWGLSLVALVGLYILLWFRIWRCNRDKTSPGLYALFIVIAKFAQLQGIAQFYWRRLRGKAHTIIEYKQGQHNAIVYIAGVFPAPSETFVSREVRELRRRGWTVYAFGLHDPPPVTEELRDLAATAEVVYGAELRKTIGGFLRETVAHPLRTIRTLARAMGDAVNLDDGSVGAIARIKILPQAFAAVGLAGRLRKLGVRHIHCHFAHASTTVGMYTARQLGVPFSFTGHANDLFQRRSLLRPKLERAAFVACISQWHKTFYESIAPGRYVVIRCGVDTNEFMAREPAAQASAILSVARLVEKKGLDTLIAATAELCRAGRPVCVRIVGDGPLRPMLEKQAAGLPVEFLGQQDNAAVRRLLSEADVFALPCRTDSSGDRDGIPVVLMEAMAAGVPVISGDLPAIRELVEHNVTGLLVPGGDAAVLTEALRSLLNDADLRRRLAAAGRQRVIEEFSLQRNIDRLKAALCGH